MDLAELIKWILLPIVLAYVGYSEKDRYDMRQKMYKLIEREEAQNLIDLKMESSKNEIKDLKEDLNRIEDKLDKILDRMVAK